MKKTIVIVSITSIFFPSMSLWAQSSMELQYQKQQADKEIQQNAERARYIDIKQKKQIEFNRSLKYVCGDYSYAFLGKIAYEGYSDMSFTKWKIVISQILTGVDPEYHYQLGKINNVTDSKIYFSKGSNSYELNTASNVIYTRYTDGQISKSQCAQFRN